MVGKSSITLAELAGLTKSQLLALRFSELNVRLPDTPLQPHIDRLNTELADRGLRFRPHCWLAEEWFSPDASPGIAIPFYLIHPCLIRLEYEQMFEVEGRKAYHCLRLLRHEAGHAINTAYQLHKRKRWQVLFGHYNKPYPEYYAPKPQSKRYVQHLDWWYAQSHPSEDFAETFAVWLTPHSAWYKQYKDWPALRKLEYVDELMQEIANKPRKIKSRKHIESLATSHKTLAEHYAAKRKHYRINAPEVFDGDINRLFPIDNHVSRNRKTAAALLQRLSPEICQICCRNTGEHPYVFAQLLGGLIHRCRELKRYVCRPEADIKYDLCIYLSMIVADQFKKFRYKVPL